MNYAVIYRDGVVHNAIGLFTSPASADRAADEARYVATDVEVVPLTTWRTFRAFYTKEDR